ncbi:MAG: GNAT family N-acetyltransferase [Candidatus Woesearchaeota archaeon]
MELENLTLENYERHLPNILKSELLFPETIRLNQDQLLQILRGDRPIAKMAFQDSEYLGNILSFCSSERDITSLDLRGVIPEPRTLYLYNLIIVPKFQGRDFGKVLFQDLVNTAKTKGYATLEGHFRPNASLHIIKSEGAEVISTHANWCNTGEDYVYCRLRF